MKLLGPRALTGYTYILLTAAGWQHQIGGFNPRWNQSLDNLALLAGSRPARTFLETALAIGLLAALIWCARRTATVEVPLGAALVAGLLASPHVLIHDLTLLVIPAAVLWRWSPLRPSVKGGVLIAGYVTIAFGLPLSPALPISPAAVAMTALAYGLLFMEVRPVAEVYDADALRANPVSSPLTSRFSPLISP